MTRIERIRLILLATSTVAALSPVTISPSGHVVPSQACADGTCCPEPKSICFINGVRTDNAYYKGSGSCQNES